MQLVLPRALKPLALAWACAGVGAVACTLTVQASAQPVAPVQDAAAVAPGQADDRPKLALMGTIPIYWGEADGLESLLAGNGDAHWARARLEQHWRLQPVDHLDTESLAQVTRLLLAQPRALSGPENVALDAWVRGGGHLLLFADPMLTGESRFGIGDRRRPQDVILLSPILTHWGLDLKFDENQPTGPDLREFAGLPLPVRLAGHFATPAAGAGCVLEVAEILASCAIGQGWVVVLADAAVLDLHDPQVQAGAALDALALRAFGHVEDSAEISPPMAENLAFQVVSATASGPVPDYPASQERRAND